MSPSEISFISSRSSASSSKCFATSPTRGRPRTGNRGPRGWSTGNSGGKTSFGLWGRTEENTKCSPCVQNRFERETVESGSEPGVPAPSGDTQLLRSCGSAFGRGSEANPYCASWQLDRGQICKYLARVRRVPTKPFCSRSPRNLNWPVQMQLGTIFRPAEMAEIRSQTNYCKAPPRRASKWCGLCVLKLRNLLRCMDTGPATHTYTHTEHTRIIVPVENSARTPARHLEEIPLHRRGIQTAMPPPLSLHYPSLLSPGLQPSGRGWSETPRSGPAWKPC